jgi:hypothetical protein
VNVLSAQRGNARQKQKGQKVMANELTVRLEYSAEKDVLSIIVLPERGVETRTMGYDDGILVFHEKRNPHVIVGIEVFDFTEMICGMDHKDIVLPEFDMTFTVAGSSLRGITFEDMLTWAYGQFVAKPQLVEAT